MQFREARSGASARSRSEADEEAAVKVTAAGLALVMLMLVWHPSPLALPALSIALVVIGIAWAGLIAWRNRGSGRSAIEAMPLPGILVMFGFAAAMLGDIDHAVQSLQASEAAR